MRRFTLRLHWPSGAGVVDPSWVELEAETIELAKLQAAMFYAGAEFRGGPPLGYSILDGDTEIYRFPEATLH